MEIYGMSECTGPASISTSDRYRTGKAGYALPGTELKIAEDGEVCMHGPHVFKGYMKNEAATAEAIDSEGWLHSGDIGTIDENGFLQITDRKKELIIKGGENISPREIDDTLYKHNAVLEACTFGIVDDNYGEEISACVFLKENLDANEKELKELCTADLGEYKTPSQIIFVDKPLPKGPSGKIQRLKIASLYNRA